MRHKLLHGLAILLLASWAIGTPVRALAQEPQAAHETPGAEEHQGRGAIDTVARLVNFAILAGTLWYLLRSPIATYLADRGTQIRSDLVNAAELKQTAAAAIEEIDRKLKALPAELEAPVADLAVGVASERIKKNITDDDQRRLLDRYVQQLKAD